MTDESRQTGLEWLEGGGVASPLGFRASGVAAGIKKRGLDLMLLVSDREASVAGLFTSNRVRAAPVGWCERIVRRGRARVVVANSGNANACTGEAGPAAVTRTAKALAAALDVDAEDVLVASTGVIGHPLPVDAIETALPAAIAALGDHGARAAEAILTTDTRSKEAAVAFDIAGRRFTLGGMTKGAGMIGPDLVDADAVDSGGAGEPHATTLLFLTTDAPVGAAELRASLRAAIDVSFNAITVDGDTSTNDTALLLANGAAGGELLEGAALGAFTHALTALAQRLAVEIVRDGEGATRVIRIEITRAPSVALAKRVAMTVANSPLVKTAFSAGEPNWGRLLMAVGRSGVAVEEERLSVCIGGLSIVENGLPTGADLEALRAAMSLPEAEVSIDLGLGDASFVAWTCDLSEEYVRINANYLT